MMDNDKKAAEKGHENVMLLAMSTLPQRPKVNTYQFLAEGKIVYFKSFSQMEPHTKYVLYMLAAKGEKLDRIVILESSKVRIERLDQWGKETATTLFLKRIWNYIGGSEPINISLEDELGELQETPADLELYQGYFPAIHRIDLENPVYFWDAVQAIRGEGGPVHLYMDMQGGDRNAVSQMNAIAELLVRQQVSIKGRYANDFEPKREKPLHTIREAGKEYRTYELISAMDIFSRYGWGDKLQQYFQGNYQRHSWERILIEAIKDASSAISRCSPDGFDRAVRRIEAIDEEKKREKEEAEKAGSVAGEVSEMDVVYQDIYQNYKDLLGQKYRYVAQIRWCLDKQFLQQALTILEAKMPYEFVHSGLLYYLKKGEDRTKLFETCEEMYLELERRDKYLMKDLNHYLIKDYCKEYSSEEQKFLFTDPWDLLTFGLGDGRRKEVYVLLNKYRSLCSLRNQMNHAAVGEHAPDGFFSYMKQKYKNDSNWQKQKKAKYEKRIRDFLDEWQQLADQVPEDVRKQVEDAG